MGKPNLDCDGDLVTCEDVASIISQDDGIYAWKGSDTLCESFEWSGRCDHVSVSDLCRDGRSCRPK